MIGGTLLFAVLAGSTVGWAGEVVETRSRLPYTYILDGGPGRLSDEAFVRTVGLGPPRLQHMQDGSCVHSYMGDRGALGRARLRAAGKPAPAPDYARLYVERAARLHKLIAGMRAVGSKTFVCYVCIMTIGGDPAKRTGFWELYDHWDSLAPLGIGPKPPTDPEAWCQRKADGRPHHFYTKNHPPYKPMFRYSICLNNPYWRQYMKWNVRMNARAGYDGNFVDNANSHRCHCRTCQKLFREFLASRYSAKEIAELFGADVKLSDARDTLAGVETRRFWAETVRRFLAMMRQAGAEAHGSWFVYPNALHRRPWSAIASCTDCDLAMSENSVGEFGTHPGSTFAEIIAGIGVQHVNDNIFCHRHTYAANGRVRAALLTRPGYPRADKRFMMNPDCAALGLAEAAAFSGGGAFLHRPASRSPELAPVRKTYNAFFEQHRRLYEGLVPYGQVALAAMAEQDLYRERRHMANAGLLMRTLMADHVLVDLVTERKWSAEVLADYPLLVVPSLRYMSDEQVCTALTYAKRGRLVTWGDVGTHDLQMRQRPVRPFGRFRVKPTAGTLAALIQRERLARPVLAPRADLDRVRVAAWADDRRRPTRIVLHLVDYRAPLGLGARLDKGLADVAVTLPVPAGWRARAVTLAAPGQPDQTLKADTTDGVARFTVPMLRIYAVCSIELAK